MLFVVRFKYIIYSWYYYIIYNYSLYVVLHKDKFVLLYITIKLCLFTYGEFRTFQINLENNLNVLKDTVFNGNEVDIFIVSQRSGNYSTENELNIKCIFEKYNCNVKFIKYWEDLHSYHETEKKIIAIIIPNVFIIMENTHLPPIYGIVGI